MSLKAIKHKIEITREPINVADAEFLYLHTDDATLRSLATTVKHRYHPDLQRATYLVMAIINYTNVCVANCDFCAFFRFPHQKGGYLLTTAEVLKKIKEFQALDADLIAFNGGFNPKLRISDYAHLFAKIHEVYGDTLTFFEMTVAEFMFACKISRLTYTEGAQILKQAGTRWVTGGGAEILTDSFRKRHSRGKYTVNDYYHAQHEILAADIGSTATMVIGFDETLAERLAHLKQLREFQEDNDCKLPSFLCWIYKPENTALGGKEINTAEYWRWLAICRIYLHNFPHIRTSVLTKNEDALRGLDYGANDFDIPLEDEVTQKAGATIAADYRHTLAYAREIGHTPVLRAPFTPMSSTSQ